MPLSPSTSAVAGRGPLHGDARRHVDAAGADAADILRQAEDAVGIGPGKIGFGHQPADRGGIGGRQPHRHHGIRDEGFKDARGKPVIGVRLTCDGARRHGHRQPSAQEF